MSGGPICYGLDRVMARGLEAISPTIVTEVALIRTAITASSDV